MRLHHNMESFTAGNDMVMHYPRFHMISHKGKLFHKSYYTEVAALRFGAHYIEKRDGIFFTRGLRFTFFKGTPVGDGFNNTLCVPTWVFAAQYRTAPPTLIDQLNPKFRRLHRWMLALAQRLVPAKRLAVAMGLPHRLGQHSQLQLLCTDSLGFIASV